MALACAVRFRLPALHKAHGWHSALQVLRAPREHSSVHHRWRLMGGGRGSFGALDVHSAPLEAGVRLGKLDWRWLEAELLLQLAGLPRELPTLQSVLTKLFVERLLELREVLHLQQSINDLTSTD